MMQPCWNLARVLLPLALASSASGQVLFEDDFENGLGAWTATDRWHVELESDPCGSVWKPFPSGEACARYGLLDQCNHSPIGGGHGRLTSPPIAIPATDGLRRPELRCWYRYEVIEADEGYDCATVQVGTTTLGEELCAQGGGTTSFPAVALWGAMTRDLTAYAGQTVQVSFSFWSDDFYNGGAGFFVDDVWIGLVAGDAFCEGDPASWTANCPCEPALGWHPDDDDGGCINSRGVRAELFGAGTPSLAADDVTLHAAGLKTGATTLLVQGMVLASGVVFGDGYWCLGSPIRRLLFQQASGNRASYPAPGQQPLSALGGAAVGQTVGYQVYYRDPSPTFCTPERWNVSNGLAVTWAP